MRNATAELQQKSADFHQRFNDPELDAYLAGLARTLETADTLYNQFGHLLKHIRATVAYQVRPIHLREAIDRSERFMEKLETEAK